MDLFPDWDEISFRVWMLAAVIFLFCTVSLGACLARISDLSWSDKVWLFGFLTGHSCRRFRRNLLSRLKPVKAEVTGRVGPMGYRELGLAALVPSHLSLILSHNHFVSHLADSACINDFSL